MSITAPRIWVTFFTVHDYRNPPTPFSTFHTVRVHRSEHSALLHIQQQASRIQPSPNRVIAYFEARARYIDDSVIYFNVYLTRPVHLLRL